MYKYLSIRRYFENINKRFEFLVACYSCIIKSLGLTLRLLHSIYFYTFSFMI